MITHELLTEDGVLIVHPLSPLTADDFEKLARDLDPWLEQHGPLKGLMIETEAFPGWSNFAGMLSHFRFVRDHHQRISRVAMVSDSAVLTIAPKVAKHVVSAEVRHFPAAEHEQACEWLKEE